MKRPEVSGAVRPLKWPLGVKWLTIIDTAYNETYKQIKNKNINLGNVHFFGLYFIIILQCTVQNTLPKKLLIVEAVARYSSHSNLRSSELQVFCNF
jgi:hypothetical protein